MKDENPYEVWERECERARVAPLGVEVPDATSGVVIEAAERLVAVAHTLAGVACERCRGHGRREYEEKMGWIDGCSFSDHGRACDESVVGVCDECWGTGRSDRKGLNLLELYNYNAIG